jgi:hypothetical protein
MLRMSIKLIRIYLNTRLYHIYLMEEHFRGHRRRGRFQMRVRFRRHLFFKVRLWVREFGVKGVLGEGQFEEFGYGGFKVGFMEIFM